MRPPTDKYLQINNGDFHHSRAVPRGLLPFIDKKRIDIQFQGAAARRPRSSRRRPHGVCQIDPYRELMEAEPRLTGDDVGDTDWWLVKDGKRQGPVTASEIETRLLSGDIGPNTRVWRRGMDAWARIAAVDDLKEILKSCPPPIDDDDSEPQVNIPSRDSVSSDTERVFLPGPASRFFARQIDFIVFGSAAWFVIAWLFPELDLSWLDNAAASSMATIFAAMIVEVPVMALTGTTLGKAIFGLSVRRLDGSRLSFGEVAKRNAYLWAQGLGLGIPIVALFFLWKSYQVAKTGARNSWDEADMINVRQKPVGSLRLFAGYATFVALLVGVVGLNTIEKQERRAAAVKPKATSSASPSARPSSWTNPETNVSGTLYIGWRYVPNRIDEPSTYWFENNTSIVIIGREVQQQPLAKYIDLLQAKVKYGQLEEKKFELDSNGGAFYVMSYRNTADATHYRIDVKVWEQAPRVFWRSVVLTKYGDERERAEARALAGVLEKTAHGDKSPALQSTPAPAQSGAKRTY